MKVEFSVGIGRHYEREVVEYDDDMSEEELQQAWGEWPMNYIDGSWEVLEDKSDK